MYGEVEVDETFIGGTARNMHKDDAGAKITGTGGMGKTAVMGSWSGTARTGTAGSGRRSCRTSGARLSAAKCGRTSSQGPKSSPMRSSPTATGPTPTPTQVIDHAESYAKGKVHTNGLENFWSLLKRSHQGHLRQRRAVPSVPLPGRAVFRFNTRKLTDGMRFLSAAVGIIGKRLTYDVLTGKEGQRHEERDKEAAKKESARERESLDPPRTR